MDLVLHGVEPNRVLIGTDADGNRWNAQEGLHDGGAKFANAMADDNNNTVTKFEDTQEYADGVAAQERYNKLGEIEALEQKALRSVIALSLDPSDNTERGYLQDYKNQIDAIRASL